MAKNQIDMNSVSLPSVPKPPVAGADAGFGFNDDEAKKRRQSVMGEMPEMDEVETDESMTSAGRLNQMLESDSPLMQRAETQGLQQANQRGLLNSSMAVGAAQGAMIDRAQPFALQDSNNLMQNARQDAAAQNEMNMLQGSTLADSFLNNQQFQQQSALQQQDYDIRSGLAEQQAGFQAQRDERIAQLDEQQMQLQAELNEAAAQNDFGRQQQLNEQAAQIQQERDELLFEQDLESTAQQYGLESDILAQEGQQAMERLYGTSLANAWGVMGNNVTDIVAQSLIEINDIQTNPNIEPEDKTELIEDIQEARDADVEFQGELYASLPETLQDTGVFPSSVG